MIGCVVYIFRNYCINKHLQCQALFLNIFLFLKTGLNLTVRFAPDHRLLAAGAAGEAADGAVRLYYAVAWDNTCIGILVEGVAYCAV